MTIKEFNKRNVEDVRVHIDKALEEVGKKLGINISSGNGTFDSNNFNLKIICSVIGDSGEVVTKELADLRRHAANNPSSISGITTDDLLKVFKIHGQTFVLVGMKIRARKNNMIIRDTDTGKEFLTNDAVVAMAIRKA